MENVLLDQEKCLACGQCISIASENFSWTDKDGITVAEVINDEITENTKTARDCCPVGAITIK